MHLTATLRIPVQVGLLSKARSYHFGPAQRQFSYQPLQVLNNILTTEAKLRSYVQHLPKPLHQLHHSNPQQSHPFNTTHHRCGTLHITSPSTFPSSHQQTLYRPMFSTSSQFSSGLLPIPTTRQQHYVSVPVLRIKTPRLVQSTPG